MTILDLIKAACKTKGVPEKYAERIQKTFKIEKAEGMEAFVDLFKENILPAIQEAENEAKTTAETAAVAAYEAKHGLKDGKPVEDPDKNKKTEEELLKDLSPEVKAYLESKNGKAALSRVAVGATLLNLPVEGLKKVIIPLPDLESQKKIAEQYYAKLSEIKELKYKLEKATEELEHIYTEEK